MSEYITRAIVLGFKETKEHDKIFDLYTEHFGRIRVKSPGGKKILSKLSPHLDVANLATVKIVEKNNLTLVDALLEDNFGGAGEPSFFVRMLELLSVVKKMSPEAVPDPELWTFTLDSLRRKKADIEKLLAVLGYNPRNASCGSCASRDVSVFDEGSQTFFCGSCASKMEKDNLVHLK